MELLWTISKLASVIALVAVAIAQGFALTRLLRARAHVQQRLRKDEALRRSLIERLGSASTLEQQIAAVTELRAAIERVAPADARVIEHTLDAQGDETKVRFARRLVA